MSLAVQYAPKPAAECSACGHYWHDHTKASTSIRLHLKKCRGPIKMEDPADMKRFAKSYTTAGNDCHDVLMERANAHIKHAADCFITREAKEVVPQKSPEEIAREEAKAEKKRAKNRERAKKKKLKAKAEKAVE